jgi:glycosyltransferase involved in cell wall biosynthesis
VDSKYDLLKTTRKRTMNILQVFPFYPPHIGGAETSIKELSEYLTKLGNKVIVLTLNIDFSLPYKRNENGIIVYRIPGIPIESIPYEIDFSLPYILNIIRKHRIDIINTHLVYFPFSLMSYLSKKFHSIPIVLTERLGLVNTKNKLTSFFSELYLKTFVKRFLTNFSGYITLTDELKRFLINLGIDSFKIEVIPNGVNTDQFYPDLLIKQKYCELFGFSKDDIIITTISRLFPTKGIDLFIKSIPNILKNNSDKNLRFLIAGVGPELQNLEKLSNELSLNGTVHFLGYRRDVKNLINFSDIIVKPSLAEGMSRVVLETLACQKPIIITNVGGISQYIKDKENSIIIKPNSIDSIVNSIQYLIDKKNKREIISKNGYNLIKDNYDWEIISKRTYNFYRNVINNLK